MVQGLHYLTSVKEATCVTHRTFDLSSLLTLYALFSSADLVSQHPQASPGIQPPPCSAVVGGPDVCKPVSLSHWSQRPAVAQTQIHTAGLVGFPVQLRVCGLEYRVKAAVSAPAPHLFVNT